MDVNKLLQSALSRRKDVVNFAISHKKPVTIGASLIILIFILLIVFVPGGPPLNKSTMTIVKKGDFTVTVTEEGSLKSLDTIDIRCEVEGHNITIISLIEEGTYITEEDVADSRILVELDSSKLKENLSRQEISLRSAEASYNQAKEELEIQRKQCESDINNARMKMKFKHMDLKKHLGTTLAEKVLKEDTVSYEDLVNSKDLGGEARKNKLRFESGIDVAQADLKRADGKLASTKRMQEKGWLSASDLELAELDHKRSQNSLEQEKIDQELFLKYDFPKKTEESLSNYLESISEYDRTCSRTESKLIKAEIDVDSKEARYKLEKEQVEKSTDQVEKCTIRATNPGLVTYASRRRWEDPLKEGSTVRKSQPLLTIPNLAKMGVDVSIQEASIDKIEEEQEVIMHLEAFPDRKLKGKVIKIGIMPDSRNRWWAADLKVYKVEIEIKGEHDFLKPGMSCEVEILAEEVKDVLMVPIQTVMMHKEKKVCVTAASSPVAREVETGPFNEKFVEIKRGLKEGERVLLYKPTPFPSKMILLPELEEKELPEPENKKAG